MDGKLHFKKCFKVFEQIIYSMGLTKKALPGVWAKFLNKMR